MAAKTSHKKWIRAASNFFENIGEFFLCQIQNDLNNCIIVLKEKKENRFLMFTRPSYNAKLGSFKLYSWNSDNEMHQKVCCTRKVVVLLLFCCSRCRRRSRCESSLVLSQNGTT